MRCATPMLFHLQDRPAPDLSLCTLANHNLPAVGCPCAALTICRSASTASRPNHVARSTGGRMTRRLSFAALFGLLASILVIAPGGHRTNRPGRGSHQLREPFGRPQGTGERCADRGRHGRRLEPRQHTGSQHQRIPQRNSVGQPDRDPGPHRPGEGGRIQDDPDPGLLPEIHRLRPELHHQRHLAEPDPAGRQLRLQPGHARGDQHARRRLQERHRLLADLRRVRPDDDQGQVPEGLAADRDQVPRTTTSA